MSNIESNVLEIKDIKLEFVVKSGFLSKHETVKVLNGIDLSVSRGTTVALVGESGCGKTTLGRTILGLYKHSKGSVTYRDLFEKTFSILNCTKLELKKLRKELRMIFQDPFSSLNPRLPVFDIIGEPLLMNKTVKRSELQEKIEKALIQVNLPVDSMRRYPHAFSGGQRQRISIARALITDPQVLIADEAVSALDVSVQAQILNLLIDLKKELGLTFIFISHDLAVVKYISDFVAVMYLGKIVEKAPVKEIFENPKHPYTKILLASVPNPNPRKRSLSKTVVSSGEIPDMIDLPYGCSFQSRCPISTSECKNKPPKLSKITGVDHEVACHNFK